MPNSFKFIDDIWHEGDVFDEVLNGSLFDVIDNLPTAGGDELTWAKVVFVLLFSYLMGFFLYHFRFSYGNSEASKPERQRNLEQYIGKLLNTKARDLISRVCRSSLHGKGWQTLSEIRPLRFPFTLNPLKLFRRFLWLKFLQFIQKTPSGAEMGLQVFSLFDSYTPEEFNELLAQIQHHSHNKRSYAYNEWDILYIVRLLAMPEHITQKEQDMLMDQVLSIEFTREDIRVQVFAELAKFNDKAVAEVDTYKKSDLPDRLVTSAHINPLSMTSLISSMAFFSSHYNYTTDDKLAKLEPLEKSSAEALLQTAHSEEATYSIAVLVATHISALTPEAREVLTSHLNSPDPHLRYLAACALLQTVRPVPMERREVFMSIMEIAIGPQYLEITEEADGRRDSLQKMATHFLLDLAESDPVLIGTFLVALRTTWKDEFANALARLFSGCEMGNDLIEKLVEHLLDGNLSAFRINVSQRCTEMHDVSITTALDRIATNDLLFYYWNNDGSPEAHLVRTCAGYILRVWPCLTFLTGYTSKLRVPHFAVMAALIALDKPGRGGWEGMPVTKSYAGHPKDSYISICQDLSLAIRILESLNEESILNLLTELEREADERTREQIMRSLRFFPRTNHILMSLLKKGLTAERKVRQAAQGSLSSLSYLGSDGVDLIIETVLSSSNEYPTTMRNNLTESPEPIAPAATSRVLEALRTSSDLTSDETREFWLVEYCLNALKFVPQEGAEFIELYKQKLRVNYSRDDLRRHLRPHFILALGRVRPVTSEMVEMLLNLTKPGRVRMAIRSLRNLDYPEIKMAAALALAEIGADLTNGIDWNMRETIANHLIWSAKQPLHRDSTFVGGKDIFPKDPNDAMYQSAKTMADIMKSHRGKELISAKGISSLE